ncbi:MAG: hypothetical protein EXS32_01135 [Opitutus sp.]|nr:hypothetical protein [Opitutus sp.]
MDAAPPAPRALAGALRTWWREPRLTWWFFALLATLLFLRKPEALTTPQLYAEDGSIFLMQAEWHGLESLPLPYMGYLHLLLRLVAWFASRLADPAWWPALYNGAAFAISLGVAARMFSRRLALPGAPWLALTFFLSPQTGEVLINLTNLQWITAFVLIQQVLIAPPTTGTQRAGDLVLLLLIGLTGPFGIAFLPLFAWGWWRDRGGDRLAALLVVAACAAVQVWFVLRTGPKFEFPPFVPSRFFEIIGQHLLIWPVLGDSLATMLPPAVVGFTGIVPVLALLGWTLRPHPRRPQRAIIVAAFALIMVAAVFRSRPDTWNLDNLIFGDRYFYIPRVLLAWLLVWEFDAIPLAVARISRALLLACALVHLNDYTVPAPPDYHWAQHCEPIRRGVPANIPTLPEGWTLEYRGRPSLIKPSAK